MSVLTNDESRQEGKSTELPHDSKKPVTSLIHDDSDLDTVEGKLPPGVAAMEAINKRLTFNERCLLFLSLLLVSYATNLNFLTLGTYQAYATSTWENHSLLSTINVVRGVISAAVMPFVAKVSDLIGRAHCFAIITLFYVVGSIIQSAAQSIQGLAVGSLFHQIGYTCCQLFIEIIVSDTTSLRARVFFLLLPSMPNVINVWVSGDLTQAVLIATTCRWGFGMWCAIYPVCTLPLMLFLIITSRRAAKAEAMEARAATKPVQKQSLGNKFVAFTHKMDLVGLFLLTGGMSMILIPLTLAGGQKESWTARIITPVVFGGIFLPLFCFWESRTDHPLVPISLLKQRTTWAAMGIACFVALSWTVQGDFLYTVLFVSYDFDIMTATRIAVVYNFCEAVVGMLAGVGVFLTRRAKPFVLAGTMLWFGSFGILYHFRGGGGSSSRAGMIAGQVLLGVAGAILPFPNIVIAMAHTKPEEIAVLTSLWLTMNWVGFAIGNSISGAIWTQLLYKRLSLDLASINNSTLAEAVYSAPLYVVPEYPIGTPERTAIITSYRHIQRLLLIAGMCLGVPIVILAICQRNTKMRGQFSTA